MKLLGKRSKRKVRKNTINLVTPITTVGDVTKNFLPIEHIKVMTVTPNTIRTETETRESVTKRANLIENLNLIVLPNLTGGNMEKLLTITELAKSKNLSRQAIYLAIKKKNLPALKDGLTWLISTDEFKKYQSLKWNRSKSTYKGKLLFDNEKGTYSLRQVAKMLGVHEQKLYYATRMKYLKASRKGKAWIIDIKDLEEYKKSKFLVKRSPSFQKKA